MDKFSFWHKWFWVGLVISVLSAPAGLVFAAALLVEPEHRKEGAALAIWSIVWLVIILVTVFGLQK